MIDIPRLSSKEYLILNYLSAHNEAYGLQMVKDSEGHLKRGTIYVTLGRMEEKNYIESFLQPSKIGPAKRVYRITGHGARVFDAWQLLNSKLALGGI